MRMLCLREHATFVGRREARRFGSYGDVLFPGRRCSEACTQTDCLATLRGAAFALTRASPLTVCSRHRRRVTLREQRRQGPREGLPEAARLVRHVRVELRLVRDGLVPVRVGLRQACGVQKRGKMEQCMDENVAHVRAKGRGAAPLHALHKHNGRQGERRALAHVHGGARMLPCENASAARY